MDAARQSEHTVCGPWQVGDGGCDGVYRYAHLKELDAKFGALQSPVALLVRHGPVAPRHKGRQPLNVQRRPLVAQLKDGGID